MRLTESQRAAILADGATFDGEYVDSESASEWIGVEQVMRALRIVAILDGLSEEQIAHAAFVTRLRAGHAQTDGEQETWRTLARALEEVGK